MTSIPKLLLLTLCLCALISCQRATSSRPRSPDTRKAVVEDVYHGVTVRDEYRWLEDWNSPEVKKWSETQNVYARNFLDHIESREMIKSRIVQLRSESESYGMLIWRKGKLFALKRQPPKQQSFVIVMDSPDHAKDARTIVDPNTIDNSGGTSIDFFEPSPDGNLIAVSMSKGGSESGEVHIYQTADGKEMGEVVPRVNGGTAGGDLAWAADGKGFYYTRYPAPGERSAEDMAFYQQVYFHKLGSPVSSDSYEIGKDFPKIAEIRIDTHPSKNYALASVQHGDGGGVEHFLRLSSGEWKRLAAIDDQIAQVKFGPNDDLYLASNKNSPRGKLLRMPISDLSLDHSRTVIPESDGALQSDFWEAGAGMSFVVTGSRIFASYEAGGPMRLQAFDLQGKPQPGPELLPVSAVPALTAIDDDLLFMNVSYKVPGGWYVFDAKQGKTRRTSMFVEPKVNFDDVDVIQEFAMSKDGTRVPYIVLRLKRLAGQKTPAIVTGYGGYAVSIYPTYNPVLRLPLEHEVAYVQAFIRGGGEYGEDWHEQGRLTKKQNVFDDFAAVLKDLIDRGYTTPDKLAITGGSNGGLLMGATFTQNPDLVKAVVSYVGIYDMLRVELSPNGAFNIPEFGTVKNFDLFRAMYAYSPYHHVTTGTQYPSILFMTGANDPRVDPMQSRKMTARLQASGSQRPVLLRTSGNTGHGIGTPLSAKNEEDTDAYSFIFHELEIE